MVALNLITRASDPPSGPDRVKIDLSTCITSVKVIVLKISGQTIQFDKNDGNEIAFDQRDLHSTS